MKYSYFPGCTLKNKAVDLDHYARISAEALGFELEAPMRSPQSWLLSVPSTMRKSTVRTW